MKCFIKKVGYNFNWKRAAFVAQLLFGILVVYSSFVFMYFYDFGWGRAKNPLEWITVLYYAVTTISTVGYGDLSPKSAVTQGVFVFVMVFLTLGGYAFFSSRYAAVRGEGWVEDPGMLEFKYLMRCESSIALKTILQSLKFVDLGELVQFYHRKNKREEHKTKYVVQRQQLYDVMKVKLDGGGSTISEKSRNYDSTELEIALRTEKLKAEVVTSKQRWQSRSGKLGEILVDFYPSGLCLMEIKLPADDPRDSRYEVCPQRLQQFVVGMVELKDREVSEVHTFEYVRAHFLVSSDPSDDQSQ